MRKILVLLPIALFLLTFISAKEAKAACHAANTGGVSYNTCRNRAGHILCGRNEEGFDVCCDGGSFCPAGTQNAISTDCGTENKKCCPGNTCNVGLTCQKYGAIGDYCIKLVEQTKCGDIGKACCTTGANKCAPGLTCNSSNICTGDCGTTGKFCCPRSSGNYCTDGSNCSASNTCVPGAKLPGYLCDLNHIKTAIGCIPINDQNALVGFFLRWGIGIAGGIAFLLILMAGFQIMTARGDPKRIQAGQELLTSAIAGIVLLIFSVFILRVIGVDILKIPGFGG